MHLHLHLPHALHHAHRHTTRQALSAEERDARTTRDLTLLVAVATGTAIALWTAAAIGAADAAWWALLLVAALSLIVALGAWVLLRDR